MKEEIKKSKEKIELAYQEKFDLFQKNCSSLEEEINNYTRLLEKHSTFESGKYLKN